MQKVNILYILLIYYIYSNNNTNNIYNIFAKGSLVRKLPSYGRLSWSAFPSSCQPQDHVNHVFFWGIARARFALQNRKKLTGREKFWKMARLSEQSI